MDRQITRSRSRHSRVTTRCERSKEFNRAGYVRPFDLRPSGPTIRDMKKSRNQIQHCHNHTTTTATTIPTALTPPLRYHHHASTDYRHHHHNYRHLRHSCTMPPPYHLMSPPPLGAFGRFVVMGDYFLMGNSCSKPPTFKPREALPQIR